MVAHSVAAELLIYISNEIGKNVTATDENVERLIAENELLYANLPSDLDDEECEEMASCCDEDWVFELFDDSIYKKEVFCKIENSLNINNGSALSI